MMCYSVCICSVLCCFTLLFSILFYLNVLFASLFDSVQNFSFFPALPICYYSLVLYFYFIYHLVQSYSSFDSVLLQLEAVQTLIFYDKTQSIFWGPLL